MAELIWEGKYDKDGKLNAPLRMALPFQTVETVNESAQQRQKNLFAPAPAKTEWRNRLIWGDKKYVLPSLLPEFAGKVDLIYIDPPFNVGADFSYQAQIGDERFTKEPSIIEQKAYRDTWGRGIDGYLSWFYDTVVLLHELLAETGSLYVHLDYHIGHYAKAVLDEVFGIENYLNELIWKRTSAGKPIYNNFPRNVDSIFLYSKSENYFFNRLTKELDKKTIATFNKDDGDGRGPYNTQPIINPALRPNLQYQYTNQAGDTYNHPPNGWRFSEERMRQRESENRLVFTENTIREKYYLKERMKKGKQISNLWNDIQNVQGSSKERLDYSTQKPEALLDRIINTSSKEDSLILDCFCGSGTTAAVAEKLNRRWITCDLGRFAIHTARKRLLEIENVRPFMVQNLGKYERQVWQEAEFGDNATATVRAYRRFLLDLYHAEPVEGYTWLHGKKGGRMVHVGSVDSPVTPSDVQQIAIEFRKSIGRGKDAPSVAGVDVLGWDFALDMHETVQQIAADAGLDVSFIRIPREVLEQKAVDQGDIRFFELAALGVEVKQKGRRVTVKLTDFMVPPDDVPDDVQKAVKQWSEWIDYWAIDFNFRDDTFHNEWQSYRTRQDRKLELQHTHEYANPGTYTILVKVIDILGNDTTKPLEVTVD